MAKPKFWLEGEVKGGKLVHDNIPRVMAVLRPLEGLRVRYLIERIPKQARYRTSPQNRYYWGVVLAMFAEFTGHTDKEIHAWMKSEFLTYDEPFRDKVLHITRSTADLSTVEFEEYLSDCRMFMSLEYGCTVPLPNESVQFYYDVEELIRLEKEAK